MNLKQNQKNSNSKELKIKTSNITKNSFNQTQGRIRRLLNKSPFKKNNPLANLKQTNMSPERGVSFLLNRNQHNYDQQESVDKNLVQNRRKSISEAIINIKKLKIQSSDKKIKKLQDCFSSSVKPSLKAEILNNKVKQSDTNSVKRTQINKYKENKIPIISVSQTPEPIMVNNKKSSLKQSSIIHQLPLKETNVKLNSDSDSKSSLNIKNFDPSNSRELSPIPMRSKNNFNMSTILPLFNLDKEIIELKPANPILDKLTLKQNKRNNKSVCFRATDSHGKSNPNNITTLKSFQKKK